MLTNCSEPINLRPQGETYTEHGVTFKYYITKNNKSDSVFHIGDILEMHYEIINNADTAIEFVHDYSNAWLYNAFGKCYNEAGEEITSLSFQIERSRVYPGNNNDIYSIDSRNVSPKGQWSEIAYRKIPKMEKGIYYYESHPQAQTFWQYPGNAIYNFNIPVFRINFTIK